MRCDAARRLLSDRFDEALAADDEVLLDQHLASCEACAEFSATLDVVRRSVRVSVAAPTPDVATAVRARLDMGAGRRAAGRGELPSWRSVAAVFVAALVLAGAVIGLSGPGTAQATDVTALVMDGQRKLTALSAKVVVVEHGWHPQVPRRVHAGTLDYAAPESLSLSLQDVTDYPDGRWPANDVVVSVVGPKAWQSGLARCPVGAMPGCLEDRPRARVVDGREPFNEVDPVPLDLVLPVDSLAIASLTADRDPRMDGGREVIDIEVSAAQIAPLLDGILQVGNWRGVHPTDRARVTLDAEAGVLVAVEVVASSGAERDRWAAAQGHADEPGQTILTWRLRDVRLNESADPVFADPPEDAVTVDDGFVDDQRFGITPGWLPDGMSAHRAGRVGDVEVASFTDGRAWVVVRSIDEWSAERLFGRHRDAVRRVVLDDGGTVYLADGGTRVLIHAASVDLEITGSVSSDDLLRIAASVPVTGQPVPRTWAEAATTSLRDVALARPELLHAPGLDGFVGPAVAVDGSQVVLSYTSGGDRTFSLTQLAEHRLGPPVDGVVHSVQIRGVTGRYTPARGTLEWVEDGHVITLRSTTMTGAELAEIAEALEPLGTANRP